MKVIHASRSEDYHIRTLLGVFSSKEKAIEILGRDPNIYLEELEMDSKVEIDIGS